MISQTVARSHRVARQVFCAIALAFAQALADPAPAPPESSPWGVSSSASSFRNHGEWLPKLAAAGVSSVRLFPEWRGVEPLKGTWKWDDPDALVDAAAKSGIAINGILMGSPPGSGKSHAFPMEDLNGWAGYVSASVRRYQGRIRHWEVWNEGNAGFNDGRHTTADYAKLALATYVAARKADPAVQIGLSVASFDAPYLNQAILALAKQGGPDAFDTLCIHPYEIADGLKDPDGEIPFLWMSHYLRGMLKASAPARADAEIWITEVGRRIEARGRTPATEQEAAESLVKIYTLALAQGIARTQWFEAQDPAGEESGFGLLDRKGASRASYLALQTLIRHLGPRPKYQGWLAMGEGGKGHGFVFLNRAVPVLVTWMPAGGTGKTGAFTGGAEVVDVRGISKAVAAGRDVALTASPVLISGLPADLLALARANATKPFPWGGDFSASRRVSGDPGSPEKNQGVFQTGRDATPTLRFPDGSTGILVRGDQSVGFYTHPSFSSFQNKEYHVRVTTRRIAPGNIGMNLQYEVADSQGGAAYKNRGIWFGMDKGDDWQTHTWHVTDACFSKMWGYDFAFRPEQSVPFVIGKVEVGAAPFE